MKPDPFKNDHSAANPQLFLLIFKDIDEHIVVALNAKKWFDHTLPDLDHLVKPRPDGFHQSLASWIGSFLSDPIIEAYADGKFSV